MRTKRFLQCAVAAGWLLAAPLRLWADPCPPPPPTDDPYLDTVDRAFGLCFDREPWEYQWGHYSLNLPAAWEWIKGHANVAVVDLGLEVRNPELLPWDTNSSPALPLASGGNLRLRLSYDFRFDPWQDEQHPGDEDACADELDESSQRNSDRPCDGFDFVNPVGPGNNSAAGHGTHVSGLVAAKTNNGEGVAGTCWGCSLSMSRVRTNSVDLPQGLYWAVDRGNQVISASWGLPDNEGPIPTYCLTSTTGSWASFCKAFVLADERDVVFVAAVGNDIAGLDYPASDPRAIAVGGTEIDGSIWRRDDDGGQCPFSGGIECGSNFGPELDLVAPAERILSTAYTGRMWINSGSIVCGDNGDQDGVGECTGTSMAAPYVAGIAALVRSANPLLAKQHVYDILTTTATPLHDGMAPFPPAGGRQDDTEGYGLANAELAVQKALGMAGQQTILNRLTPLFALYWDGGSQGDYLMTTVPQVASAAVSGQLFENCTTVDRVSCTSHPYVSAATRTVRGYGNYPGFSCGTGCTHKPKAGAYLFTGEKHPTNPNASLLPLYRLTKRVVGPPFDVDSAYAVSEAEVETFVAMGYELAALEGYFYPLGTGCSAIPGAYPLHRGYNEERGDFAVFPEFVTGIEPIFSSYDDDLGTISSGVIGCAYPNADQDKDNLINGFEMLLGTQWSNELTDKDSDGDGRTDGDEVLNYPYTDPLGPQLVVSCPCDTLQCTNLSAAIEGNVVGFPSYTWDFGDGQTGSGSAPAHTYAQAGTYYLLVTASGSFGTLENRCVVKVD